MRSNFKSWKSSLWKKAICLKYSTARSEMLPSIFSLPRCTASSKYLSIKWQICTVARELLFSSKAELSSKLSDTGDLSKAAALAYLCFAVLVLCFSCMWKVSTNANTYVVQWVFFRYRLGIYHIFPQSQDTLREYERCSSAYSRF